MFKRGWLLGIVAGGMLLGMGSPANAVLITPDYASGNGVYTYSDTGTGTFTIAVADVVGYDVGESVLSLSNLVGLTVNPPTTGNVTSVGSSYDLSTAGTNASCVGFVTVDPLAGDCSYISFSVAGAFSFSWQMSLLDPTMYDVGGGNTAQDFAFFVMSGGDNWTGDGYLIPSSCTAANCNPVPEPSTIALMAIGLLGAGFAGRRRRI